MDLNRYLVSYQRYFSGRHTVEVEAEDKARAVEEAQKRVAEDREVLKDSFRVEKKLQKNRKRSA